MNPKCISITKLVLPAIRASVADIMSNEYNYGQKEIALKLGVVQVSVSKYLNRKYSSEIGKIKGYIDERRLTANIARAIADGKTRDQVGSEIDELAATLSETLARINYTR